MDSASNVGEAGPAAPRPNQRGFLDELIMTFSSPMAWLLVLALVVTWSGVAIVLFDLLDYKTLAGTDTHTLTLTHTPVQMVGSELQVLPVCTCSNSLV